MVYPELKEVSFWAVPPRIGCYRKPTSLGSLGTTTSPQQQNASKLKDLCQVRNA